MNIARVSGIEVKMDTGRVPKVKLKMDIARTFNRDESGHG